MEEKLEKIAFLCMMPLVVLTYNSPRLWLRRLAFFSMFLTMPIGFIPGIACLFLYIIIATWKNI